MGAEREASEQPPDGTWLESGLASTGSTAPVRYGLRPTTAQLCYIGSAENHFAHAGRTFSLSGVTKVEFGRVAGEDLSESGEAGRLEIGVPIPWVSGAHAELEVTAREGRVPSLRLVDLGSRNGTAIEGQRVEGTNDLVPGQVFELGRSFWTVREVLEGTKPPPTELEPTGTCSPVLGRIYRNLDRLARTRMPLLLVGETGTGKDYVARAVHARSGRKGELIKVNLLGLSMAELLMGEAGRPGLLQRAQGGTVYVDELASLERDAQTKLGALLSYAEEEEGGGGGRGDLRVIASSTRDLRELVEGGFFRPDLYARLAHYEAHLPALRERREDLGLLLASLTHRGGRRMLRIETSAFRRILAYSWPFNLRELRQTIAAVSALADDDGTITVASLEEVMRRDTSLPSDPVELQKVRETLLRHLAEQRGNVVAVARVLGQPTEQLERIMRQFHIDTGMFNDDLRSDGESRTLVDMRSDAVREPK